MDKIELIRPQAIDVKRKLSKLEDCQVKKLTFGEIFGINFHNRELRMNE